MADQPETAPQRAQSAGPTAGAAPDGTARAGRLRARVVPPGEARALHNTRAGMQKVYVPPTPVPPAPAAPPRPAPERPTHLRRTGQQKVYVPAQADSAVWMQPRAGQAGPAAQGAAPVPQAPVAPAAPAPAPSAAARVAAPSPRPQPGTAPAPAAGRHIHRSPQPATPGMPAPAPAARQSRPAPGQATVQMAVPAQGPRPQPGTAVQRPVQAPPTPAPAAQEDGPAPARTAAHGRKADRVYAVLMVLFGLVFLVSAGLLLKRLWEDRQAEDKFSSLQTVATASIPASTEGSPNAALFAALRAKNSDFAGWIRIEDTRIDYPVMYAPDREDYYLKRDFDGNSSSYGVPYIEEKCTLTEAGRSNNLVIYGHHMKTGTMFSDLTGYLRQDFFEEHPIIEFDTVYGDAQYEVFAAFAVDVVAEADFAYDTYTDLDPDMFAWFVDTVCKRSRVKTDIHPAYGDELITLSTCEYSTADGRCVVCARRITDPQPG